MPRNQENCHGARRRSFLHHYCGGFTLVEVMIVVCISMIALTVAVPNFIHAREMADQRTCIAQLHQVDSAKRQYALDQKLSDGDTVLMSSFAGPGKYIPGPTTGPVCPAGGTYSVGAVGVTPACSKGGGHVITD